VPIRSRDAPPFGLSLAPRHDSIGRVRDRLAGPLTVGTLGRIIAKHTNPVRAELGLAPLRILEQFYLAASAVLAYTAEPFEYPRRDWPATVHLVGPGLWAPPADPPAWLGELRQPLVLVTCSTACQNDIGLAEAACAALAGEPFDVVLTTGDVDTSGIAVPANVRIERFVPHAPALDRAACTVCHAGMGITQKSLAHGVPVVAVPFSRDQPEVSRRVRRCRHQAPRPQAQPRPAPRRRTPRHRTAARRPAHRRRLRRHGQTRRSSRRARAAHHHAQITPEPSSLTAARPATAPSRTVMRSRPGRRTVLVSGNCKQW
jgi:hypothetical protein